MQVASVIVIRSRIHLLISYVPKGLVVPPPLQECLRRMASLIRSGDRAFAFTGVTRCGKTTYFVPAMVDERFDIGGTPNTVRVSEPKRQATRNAALEAKGKASAGIVGHRVQGSEHPPGSYLNFCTLAIIASQTVGRGTLFRKVPILVIDEAHERLLSGDMLI